MRKVLTALLTAGCLAAGTALSASTAYAQVDAWNGGWHVGGDYYYPTYSSYAAAPIYDYGAVPAYSTTGYSSTPLYDYATAPAYGSTGYTYGSAPLYDEVGPAYSPRGYSYAATPLYDYGTAPAYSPAVGAQIQPVRTVEIVRTVYLPSRSVVGRQKGPTAARRPAEITRSRPRQNETALNVAAPVSRDTAHSNGAGRAQPLYDTAAAPIAHAAAASADAKPPYRYVYQRDRILVVDPGTNAVVQTLRR